MPTFNDSPRPRVLFEDVPEEIYTQLSKLVPTATKINSDARVHESEFDMLVTFADNAAARSNHLHVLAFGPEYLDSVGGAGTFARSSSTMASTIEVPDSLDEALQTLVSRSIVPTISSGQKWTWSLPIVDPRYHIMSNEAFGTLAGQCDPLVWIGPEQRVYALRRRRVDNESGGLCVAVPSETTDHVGWLEYMLAELRELDPTNFAFTQDWRADDEWATHAMKLARANEEQLQERARDAAEEYARRISIAQSEYQEASEDAARGSMRLLTADGDSLVRAVADALEAFGFVVQNMDEHRDPKTGGKLEDLRISTPSDPDWTSLVEVKGYKSGAKVNDIPQVVGRPSVAFAAEFGREPNSVFHVVNAWRHRDPNDRPVAVPNDRVDLAPLTDADGALIDTRDLFRALRDVESGVVQPEAVRDSLISARTRWVWLSSGNGASPTGVQ